MPRCPFGYTLTEDADRNSLSPANRNTAPEPIAFRATVVVGV